MTNIKFTKNGITLVFYKKLGDEKFSFLVKEKEELTEKLIKSVKTKRVKEKNIKYAVKGIFEKIENNFLRNEYPRFRELTLEVEEYENDGWKDKEEKGLVYISFWGYCDIHSREMIKIKPDPNYLEKN